MIEPAGYYVAVIPDPVERESDGGIILGTESEFKRESRAATTGTVLKIGPISYDDHGGKEHWPGEGDRVIFSKYGAKFFTDPETGNEILFLNDNDIVASFSEESVDE